MLGIIRRNKVEGMFLSEQRAHEIIQLEIQRRGWSEYPDREYWIERQRGQKLWCYSGFDFKRVGSRMSVQVYAVTGVLVHAAITPR